jgi:hypothetical protein
MSELRNCFAYNQQGQRCDMPAGHPGDHAITTTWTDEECYAPYSAPVPTPRVYDGMASFPEGSLGPPPMPGDTDECLICDHRMHRGMCKADECDCKNGMPK